VNTPRRAPAWRRYLRFWGNDPARDLDDELRFHLEARYDDYLREGMDPVRARAEAERRFGDVAVVREQCSVVDAQSQRKHTMTDLFTNAGGDLRHALRQFRRNRALSIAAILCFALGIGANTSIFSVVDAILFRPLPFPESDRLVLIGEALPQFGGENFGVISAPEYADYKQLEGRVFDKVAIYDNASLSITGDGEPERVMGAAVSASLFDVLRVHAARGRTFLPGDDAIGSPNVAVLSDAIWKRRFAADPHIVGRTIGINGVATTIVGVLPPGFAFPLPGSGGQVAEVFSPYLITPAVEKTRGNAYGTTLIARLAPGVTIDQARRGASEIASRLTQMHPGAYGQGRIILADVFSLHEHLVGQVRRSLLVLLAAVGLVLLIACINVSSLLLAHAAARRRELSVRRALGASRARLAQQFFVESLVLVVLGASLGVGFAVWGSRALAQHAPQALLSGYVVSVDARVLLVTAAIAAVTAVAISLLPAFQQPERALAGSLRDEGRAMSGGVARQRGRRALVVSQIALATIMAAGAGLMVRSLLKARNVDPGFDPGHLAMITLGLNDYRYPDPPSVFRFEQDMLDRLRVLPSVSSVTASSSVPSLSFSIEGRDLARTPFAAGALVFSDYFKTMRIPIRAGQAFTGRETMESPRIAIISQTLARQLFADSDPIGKRIKWGSPTSPAPWCTIIGVAGDVRDGALDAPIQPQIYFPALQSDSTVVSRFLRSAQYVVRSSGDPTSLFGAIRGAVRVADPELPIVGPRTAIDGIAKSLAGREFNTVLLGSFALLALVLAAVGIYGLMAYAVVQRTREIGVRLAIGATPLDVLRLVVGQATRVALAGVVIGVAGALLLTRIMGSLLFDVSPLDPLTFAASALTLFAIAALASFLPARRAANIDPQLAIRAE
jgi:Acidobacterial duplicated orphan permease